jgi:hypothetical protein
MVTDYDRNPLSKETGPGVHMKSNIDMAYNADHDSYRHDS